MKLRFDLPKRSRVLRYGFRKVWVKSPSDFGRPGLLWHNNVRYPASVKAFKRWVKRNRFGAQVGDTVEFMAKWYNSDVRVLIKPPRRRKWKK